MSIISLMNGSKPRRDEDEQINLTKNRAINHVNGISRMEFSKKF